MLSKNNGILFRKNVVYYSCRRREGQSRATQIKEHMQAFFSGTAIRGRKREYGCLLFAAILAFILKGVYIQLAEKLKIIPLGGLDEIGKNITLLEYGKDMIVVDCGVGFPDEDMYGVDLVIPDFSYLVANQKKLRGMFITHGHEDHIGAIPYAMQQFTCPVHGTAMTNGLIKL